MDRSGKPVAKSQGVIEEQRPSNPIVYYSNWDGRFVVCPGCGSTDHLTTWQPKAKAGHHELGVTHFRCACGRHFKEGGLVTRTRMPR